MPASPAQCRWSAARPAGRLTPRDSPASRGHAPDSLSPYVGCMRPPVAIISRSCETCSSTAGLAPSSRGCGAARAASARWQCFTCSPSLPRCAASRVGQLAQAAAGPPRGSSLSSSSRRCADRHRADASMSLPAAGARRGRADPPRPGARASAAARRAARFARSTSSASRRRPATPKSRLSAAGEAKVVVVTCGVPASSRSEDPTCRATTIRGRSMKRSYIGSLKVSAVASLSARPGLHRGGPETSLPPCRRENRPACRLSCASG